MSLLYRYKIQMHSLGLFSVGKVLRFVGVFNVQSRIQTIKADLEKWAEHYFSALGPMLIAIANTHLFATSLRGSDNIVVFRTERHSPRRLIVQGAGAGAAVTAMGVMSDLLKLV